MYNKQNQLMDETTNLPSKTKYPFYSLYLYFIALREAKEYIFKDNGLFYFVDSSLHLNGPFNSLMEARQEFLKSFDAPKNKEEGD